MTARAWNMGWVLHTHAGLRLAQWAGAVGGALVLSGCVVAPLDAGPSDYGYSSSTIYTHYGYPPPPRMEPRPHRPSASAVWVDGLWLWSGQRYQWQPGHWQHPGRGHWQAPPPPPPRWYRPVPPPPPARPLPPPRLQPQPPHWNKWQPGRQPPGHWQPGLGPRPPQLQPERPQPPKVRPQPPARDDAPGRRLRPSERERDRDGPREGERRH